MLETESDSVGFPRAAVILTFVGLECRFANDNTRNSERANRNIRSCNRVSRIAADLIARGVVCPAPLADALLVFFLVLFLGFYDCSLFVLLLRNTFRIGP